MNLDRIYHSKSRSVLFQNNKTKHHQVSYIHNLYTIKTDAISVKKKIKKKLIFPKKYSFSISRSSHFQNNLSWISC